MDTKELVDTFAKYNIDAKGQEIFKQMYDMNSDLLKTIIKVTEGKIFVEFEYSQAIRKMTEIYLKNKQINEAAKLVQDVQIETFGSLDNKYKVDYILFQMQVQVFL